MKRMKTIIISLLVILTLGLALTNSTKSTEYAYDTKPSFETGPMPFLIDELPLL